MVDSGMGSTAWVCSACAWGVSYVVCGCNVVAILNMADMVCLNCLYAETGECMSSVGSVQFDGV